ncbi:MAG: Spy/CpxP family protein refolding chaperone [Eubacteriales bacterium]
MKKTILITLCVLTLVCFVLNGCNQSVQQATPLASSVSTANPSQPVASTPAQTATDDQKTTGKKDNPKPSGSGQGNPNSKTQSGNQYSLEQAMSDQAQLDTIAFSGLAFITGNAGGDTFFPPGKVADFFGFQYMRDVDQAGYGHNTTFLSKAADNVLHILTDDQKQKLIALAKVQAPLYDNFAYNRFPLMNAFRRSLEGKVPTGSTGLNTDAVAAYTSKLYQTDADISYNRAVVVGQIIQSFTADQKAYFAKMQFDDSSTWPDVAEDQTLKKGLTNDQFTCVMTYASELFSWYKGSIDADVYFCPERHGTYFGGFFMKDYAAMNNPDYFISTSKTGDLGQGFLDTLNDQQKALITGIIDAQRSNLAEISKIRTDVSTELRKALSGGTVDKDKVYTLIEQYGSLDGQMSAMYAERFTEVNKTLTDDQRAALVKLRDLNVVPKGAYCFASEVSMPTIPGTDYLFGAGSAPSDEGQLAAPAGFAQVAGSPNKQE